ncbi:hypothetical protein TBK1r_61980 [Stieleria magnilauensis]|uniref:PD-(D/E)XK nuclease family transposase n=2 Tax=Stieleria magnilauensis TaxID=2527963 RepID=A0ABX5XYS7_9BACT|nr:hypothetical protein TBK1r_61980 [Planctomycetes bacterium TBK1r]
MSIGRLADWLALDEMLNDRGARYATPKAEEFLKQDYRSVRPSFNCRRFWTLINHDLAGKSMGIDIDLVDNGVELPYLQMQIQYSPDWDEELGKPIRSQVYLELVLPNADDNVFYNRALADYEERRKLIPDV